MGQKCEPPPPDLLDWTTKWLDGRCARPKNNSIQIAWEKK